MDGCGRGGTGRREEGKVEGRDGWMTEGEVQREGGKEGGAGEEGKVEGRDGERMTEGKVER